MSKLQRIKTMLAELLELEMSSATSDKGVIFWDGELGEGVAVYVEDEEGNKVPAEDNTYEIGNATEKIVIEVAEGKVKTYEVQEVPFEEPAEEEPAEEEEPVAEPEAEPTEEPAEPEVTEEPEEEEPLAEEEPAEEPAEEEKEEENELRKQIDELRAVVDVLKAELEALKGKPLAMSAAEEFQAIQKNAVTKGIERYAEAIAQLRKN